MARLVPDWVRGYRRAWLGRDAVAGIVVWSVVTPQCVAYAQIAGLPPQAGLMAAPVAMFGYALLGGSRTLIVSATTAASAVSAAAIGPMAHGDTARFALLSAALALVTAVVLICAGLLRFGAISDLVSKPVMTGFLFGVGLTVMIGQLPAVFGVASGSGDFIPRLRSLIDHLGSAHAATLVVGAGSIALIVGLRRWAPRVPGTLVTLAAGIAVSAILHLDDHGVAVVGHLPTALPDPSWPGAGAHDFAALVPTAFGVMLLTTEAVGVARTLAAQRHEAIDANRELIAIGLANGLAGLGSGFVQSGGASQTAAAEEAAGRSQLTAVVAAALVLLTGWFLAPVFKDLPEATLSAIVIVAVAGFVRVDELRRFARVRRSALLFGLLALAGVLVLGVLPGLIVTAVLSLGRVIAVLSRPGVRPLARDPRSGAWGEADRHSDWRQVAGPLVVGVSGPVFYANSVHVKEAILRLAQAAGPSLSTVVLDLSQTSDLDLQSLDAIGELVRELRAGGIELVLADVHSPVLEILRRGGVLAEVTVAPTLDGAIAGVRTDGFTQVG